MQYIETPAFEVAQGAYKFYVGVLSAKTLLRVAYVQARSEGHGVQRVLSVPRLREIGAYVQLNQPPGLLPNAIIVGLSGDARFDTGARILRIPDRKDEAFVIDGQHRLFAFSEAYTGDFDMTVVFTAFIGLPLKDLAYLFRTINYNQRKINPSLVYDLVPYLREDNWVEFEDDRAQLLVQMLNEEEDSPWHGGISMLGGREQPITQASFVAGVKRLLKRGQVLSETFMDGAFAGQEMQYALLKAYFTAVAQEFPGEWRNDQFIISRNLGVSAFLAVLGDIIGDMAKRRVRMFSGDELTLRTRQLSTYLERLHGKVKWSRQDTARQYLGAAGIRTLSEEMRHAMDLA